MLVTIVIPCYNSASGIRKVVELTKEVFASLPGYECEFVLVDDCSSDGTYGEICNLAEGDPSILGIGLMRNFGQHNAIMCGLNHAWGDLIMGMDDDLQTHPSQIPAIIHKIEEGYDVVYGVYRESANGILKNFTSWLNRVSAQKLLGRAKGIQTSNFWLITKSVRDEVVKYKNYNPYVEALFGCMTNNVGNVTIDHHKREQGTSNYTLSKLAKLWLAYFNYTVVPLRLASAFGAVVALLGFFSGIATAVYKLLVPDVVVGWSSVVCILLFFFGVTLLVLGVIGEYLGNLVLSTNGTPQYIVRSTTAYDGKSSERQHLS